MGAKTSIEWTRSDDGSPGASWNPIRARDSNTGKVGWQCEIITPGCENCYAQGINKRLGTGLPYLRGLRGGVEAFLDEKMLREPQRWKRPRYIFVCSMSDLFGEWVPDEMIDRVFEIIGACDDQGLGHTFQVLTKRAERQRDYMKSDRAYTAWNRRRMATEAWPPRNIWSGVSIEDQRRADERIPVLLDTPAAIRWVSAEPLLGPVSLRWLPIDYRPAQQRGETISEYDACKHFNWLVLGGESGPQARPFNIQWARAIIRQCKAARVACFVKQLGSNPIHRQTVELRDRKGGDPTEWPADLRVREYPT